MRDVPITESWRSWRLGGFLTLPHRVLLQELPRQALGFGFVVLGEGAVEDQAQQVVLDAAYPGAGLAAEDRHELVAVEGAGDFFDVFLRLDLLAALVEGLHAGQGG